jgi:COP9 signalosome complex subunit 1
MDIDAVDSLPGYNGYTQSNGKPFTAPVDDAHPFDLDSYISGYSGQSHHYYFVLRQRF